MEWLFPAKTLVLPHRVIENERRSLCGLECSRSANDRSDVIVVIIFHGRHALLQQDLQIYSNRPVTGGNLLG
jgi:hypothetical protein